MEISLVAFWKVTQLDLAYYAVEDVELALKNLILSTVASKLNEVDLEEVTSLRSQLNQLLLLPLNETITFWGVKLTRVEVENIVPIKADFVISSNTIDVKLGEKINWKAVNYTLSRLKEDDIDLTISSIEDSEQNKPVLKFIVARGTNKEKSYSNFIRNYMEYSYEFSRTFELELKTKEAKLEEVAKRRDEQLKEFIYLVANKSITIPINIPINNYGSKATLESKVMNESNDQSRKIENKDGNVIGNNLGDDNNISSTATQTINQLPAAPEPNKPGIKELITELQTLIEAETNLTDKNKEKARKQIKALAEAAQNPKAEEKQDLADTAITMLKGIVTGLPSAATLIEACTKIAALLGLA